MDYGKEDKKICVYEILISYFLYLVFPLFSYWR